MDFRFGVCTCGCGNPTPSRLFVPGHNQRLKGALIRSNRRAQLVRIVQPVSEPVLVTAPAAADLLGPEWLAWVAPEVDIERSAKEAARASTLAAADAFAAEWEADL